MLPDPRFAELMQELRAGDPTAAERIFRSYARRLIGLARSRLSQTVRAKADPEDVVQSVFRSFFTRQADGQFELGSWNDLWSLLATITLRKCGHKIEHFRAGCRDVSREAAPPATDDSVASFALIAREPSPAEAAMMIETVEHIARALDPRDRRVLELRMQGATMAEISSELDCTERTVERALERIRRKLEKAVE
jgi:RNA polymerase sigma factor (sigma-70 family)